MKTPIEDFPRSPSAGSKDVLRKAKAKKERDEIAPSCSGGHTFVYRGSPRVDLRCLCRAVTYAERSAARPPGFR